MAKQETPKRNKPKPKPKVHKDLDGFDISIDSFGEIHSNMNIEKINQFLNDNVDDKKLLEREDQENRKKQEKAEREEKKKKK